MNSHLLTGIEAVLAERNRCAEIAERYAASFERKRLFNSARAMSEVASAIRTDPDRPYTIQRASGAHQSGGDFAADVELPASI